MDERVVQFRVGAMVLATLLITAILGLRSATAGSGRLSHLHPLSARPRASPATRRSARAASASARSPTSNLARTTGDVIVAAEIDANRTVYHDEDCCVHSPLMGWEATPCWISSARRGRTTTPIVAGETIDGVRSESRTQAIGDLQTTLNGTMIEVKKASGQLAHTLAADRLAAEQERRSHRQHRQQDRQHAHVPADGPGQRQRLMADQNVRAQFKDAIKKFPTCSTTSRKTAERMGDAMAEAKKNLGNWTGSPTTREERRKIARLSTRATENLDLILTNLNQFSAEDQRPQRLAGPAASDPELYQHVIRTVRNIDELTRKLRPILDDARVFSDKIARHPEVLGVRGAIERNAGIK